MIRLKGGKRFQLKFVAKRKFQFFFVLGSETSSNLNYESNDGGKKTKAQRLTLLYAEEKKNGLKDRHIHRFSGSSNHG